VSAADSATVSAAANTAGATTIAGRLQRWLGRIGRMVRRRYAPGAGPHFVCHQRYRQDLGLPEFDSARSLKILAFLESRGLLHPDMVHQARPTSLRRLELVHDHQYLRSLQEPGALQTIVGRALSAKQQDAFLSLQRAMVGGTVHATALALKQHATAINLGGGLHHALPDNGQGFCVFNAVAVAIETFRKGSFDPPILVIDLDLHDGDGTRRIYANDPTVYTFSIHNTDLGDTTAVASTSVALGSDVTDEPYLAALGEHLPAILAEFSPGLVFYLAGCDLLVEDRLGDWRLSLDGLLARDRLVINALGELPAPPPVVILLAGGYGHHTWRHGAGFFSWLLTGDATVNPPLELELPVAHYRRHLERLWPMTGPGADAGTGTGAAAGAGANANAAVADWTLTDADLGLVAGPVETRFLGHFSRLGVELALEETGLLNRLRDRGFPYLKVAFDLTDPMGHLLRISTREESPQILLELKLRVDRHSMPGWDFLAVEWLLMQSAGKQFHLDQSPLPGQRYPGLGLLRETAAVLVVLCEQLELDGLTYLPAHYYLADRSKPIAFFWDPQQEARFRAVQRALRGLRLSEASAAVAGGRVRDQFSGNLFVYEPHRLVIPVSDRLKDSPFTAAYWERVREFTGQCAFELVVESG